MVMVDEYALTVPSDTINLQLVSVCTRVDVTELLYGHIATVFSSFSKNLYGNKK